MQLHPNSLNIRKIIIYTINATFYLAYLMLTHEYKQVKPSRNSHK